ncbi:hypothetical protein HY635_01510, partial [Candidatus Uhrbacteria bacterium]|nr:hypothetical protein [Candidatus Uhrbacteria bacterium]
CDRHVHTLRGEEVSAPSESYGCVATLAVVPPKPSVGDIGVTTTVFMLGQDTQNPSDTEVAIRDARSTKYVGADGTFGAAGPSWTTMSRWGGSVTVRALAPETSYALCVLARNRSRVETACSGSVAVATLPEPRSPEPPPTNTPPVNQPPTNQPPTNQPEPPPDRGSPLTNQPPTNQPPINEPPVNQPPTNAPPTNESGPPAGGTPATPTGPTVTAAALPTIAITAPADGATTNATTIVVNGSGPAVASVSLAVDGAVVSGVTSDASGAFAFLAPPLADGPHTATATAMVAGGVSVVSSTRFTVDRTPPPTPVVHDARSVERVESKTAANAFDVTVEVRGTFTVEEFGSLDALLITVASDPTTFTYRPTSREWAYRNTMPLEPGAHTVRVASRDRAGNVSLLPQALSFVVPPAQCGDSVDNDADGLIDFPSDPDCRSVVDDREEREGVVTRAVTAVATATTATAKAVVKTTTTAAKATAKTAEVAAVVVQQQVLDNPAVEVANERYVAPTVVVAVAANTATATATTGFQFLSYLQHLIGLLLSPGRLIARRRRRAWGTVYASLSKRPIDLATVRLTDAATGKVVATEVTDHLGRYSFLVKRAGSYRIEVQHARSVFPSSQLKGKKSDPAFADLYFGGSIAVTDAGKLLTVNIPLDMRAAREEPDRAIIRRYYLRIVSAGISASGLVFSLVSFSISPRPFVAGILGVNVLLYLLFRRMAEKRPKSWGAIADAAVRKPIHLAVARLFDTEFNKLLETAVTDRYGRYSFLVGKNVYYVTGQKTGYALAKSDHIDLTKQEGVVGVDLRLKPTR